MIIMDSLRAGHSSEEILNAFLPPTLTLERLTAAQELRRICPGVTEEDLMVVITSGKGLQYF